MGLLFYSIHTQVLYGAKSQSESPHNLWQLVWSVFQIRFLNSTSISR